MSTSAIKSSSLEQRLRAVGAEFYHHRHPFHQLMHDGRLSRTQLQAWALNRYYYQSMIPVKDAIILSRSTDPAFRVAWLKRVHDHDGDGIRQGGIEKWIHLCVATRLDRAQVINGEGTLPGVRYAVNEYLNLVAKKSFLEAVASSLTELFSRDLIALRVDRLREHYPWLAGSLEYFEGRMTQAPEDAGFALGWVTEHAKSPQDEDLAVAAVRAKCDILWAQLDAIYFAYVEPGWPSPGSFKAEKDPRR